MRFTRLFSATALAAAVTLLASCGESSSPTSTSATDPSFEAAPRAFTITQNPTVWSKNPSDPIPTDTRTILIGGVIAVASYPTFGPIVYSGNGNGWLDIVTTPNISLSPLAWKVTVKLKPSAQTLPIGSYNATISVRVPAAIPEVQQMVITFNNCGNCIMLGDSKPGVLTTSSPRWNRGNNLFAPGNFAWQDWRLLIDPGQTVWVQQIGGSYQICSETGPLGTQSDPVIYMFTLADAIVASNDDFCGYSSQIGPFSNFGPTRIEYHVRSTQYCDVFCDSFGYNSNGTYTIRVVSIPFFGSDEELRAGDGADIAKKHFPSGGN